MARGKLRTLPIQIEMALNNRCLPSEDGTQDHGWAHCVVGPAAGQSRRFADRAKRGKVRFRRRGWVCGGRVQKREGAGAGVTKHGGSAHHFLQIRHSSREDDRLSRGSAGAQQRIPRQLIRGDLEASNIGIKLPDRPKIERRAQKGDPPHLTAISDRFQKLDRQFPLFTGAMLGTAEQYLRCEHFIDSEKLKLDRTTADLGRNIDEAQAAIEIARVIGRHFRNEKRELSSAQGKPPFLAFLTKLASVSVNSALLKRAKVMAHKFALNASEPWLSTSGQAHYGPVLDRIGDYDIIACETCNFRHVLPLPEPKACSDSYRDEYYASTKPDYLTRASDDRAWAQMFYRDRLSALEEALALSRQQGLKLLDVGSGPGHFLDEAIAQGWSAQGVEPSRQASAFCRARGLEVHAQPFNPEFVQSVQEFDAIHCMNMLEHVPDPITVVALAWQSLKPHGALCIGVPNDYSPFQLAARQAGAAPWWLAPPHHLNYFDFESLEGLLRRTGFEPVSRLTSFPMEMFVLMGKYYPGNDGLGRSLHAERKHFDAALQAFGPEARRKLYRSLAAQGIGREAIVIARKVPKDA